MREDGFVLNFLEALIVTVHTFWVRYGFLCMNTEATGDRLTRRQLSIRSREQPGAPSIPSKRSSLDLFVWSCLSSYSSQLIRNMTVHILRESFFYLFIFYSSRCTT